ncbi:MAG TPA: hypothetical protein VJ464_19695 [Blastocatellia bacterium]|nr:hypothetical protein [Blastocatellia bacterium]
MMNDEVAEPAPIAVEFVSPIHHSSFIISHSSFSVPLDRPRRKPSATA